MSQDKAWDHFVQQVLNVAGGIELPEKAVAAGKAYAAAAVAEARAPLVALLRLVEWQAGDDPRDGLRCPVCCRWKGQGGHTLDCPLAAALAAKGETG